MKKVIMTLMLIASFAVQASAQEIYHEVKRMLNDYEKVKNDTTISLETRKLATFKWDAIYYQIYNGGDCTEGELGVQVSAMIDFVNLYLDKINNARKAEAKRLIMAKFRNATIENARFNDVDKETVYAYVDNQNFLTQFSLDTDWVKALEEVKKK